MRFLKTLLLTAAALTSAALTLPFTWTPSPSSLQTCSSATFSPLTTLPPASWRDCAALYSSWAGVNGSFTIYPADDNEYGNFITILKADACTLAVKPGAAEYFVGDADVDAILKEVLNGFSSGTLVAAKGAVVCDTVRGAGEMEWLLFDSGA
jgi:hypothetical protein